MKRKFKGFKSNPQRYDSGVPEHNPELLEESSNLVTKDWSFKYILVIVGKQEKDCYQRFVGRNC